MRKGLGHPASVVLLASAITSPAFSQGAAPPAPAWSGSARCELTVQGPGYTDRQTHTWTMGGPPRVEGAFRVYAGTWSVAGGGSLHRSQGNQVLTAQWTTNASPVSAAIAVFVRASDGRMFIQSRHAQVRARDAIQGSQQLTIGGKAQTPVKIGAEAFEWSFPAVEVSGGSTSANGSSAPAVNGSVGYMQPAGSRAAASCTWQFSQSSSRTSTS
jgi:hypothetical protein